MGVATPKEEIDAQHQQAMDIVYNNNTNNNSNKPEPMTMRGEIPLKWKLIPTVDDPFYINISNNNNNNNNNDANNNNNNDDNVDEEKKTDVILPSTTNTNTNTNTDSDTNSDSNKSEGESQSQGQYSIGSCVSTRGLINVDKIASIIKEGYNTPPKPKPKQSSKSKPVKTTSKAKSMLTATTKTKPKPLKPVPIKIPSTNLWHPTTAQKHNVEITRPSHDSWGIQKIILLFCDDFLQNVYEMPYFYKKEYTLLQESLKPIYDVLGLTNNGANDSTGNGANNGEGLSGTNRIVRMLFASLPPGVTIPIHHDTGEWVKHTHRIHIPIIVSNPDNILFQVGPLPNNNNTYQQQQQKQQQYHLQRINCIPGHIFEMNNQAKHTVSNCENINSNHYRVHLIIDYVDEDFEKTQKRNIHRIQLNPGEKIIQTRRSIDRDIDKGIRPTPSFLILGVQKSGTTSLYEYMNQHPLIIRAKRRETHCFDWRWLEDEVLEKNQNTKSASSSSSSSSSTKKTLSTKEKKQKQREYCLSFFYTKELYNHPSLLTGDSTPSYLLDSYRVIPRIKNIFDKGGDRDHDHDRIHYRTMKFIIMLRNPTKRVKSHYEMVTSLDGTEAQIKARGVEWVEKSMEEVIYIDFCNMKECGLIPYWNMDVNANVNVNADDDNKDADKDQHPKIDMEVFHSFVGSKEEDEAFALYLQKYVKMNTGSHSIITRGMYELQLRQWMKAFDKDQFLVLKLENMSSHGNNAGGGGGNAGGVQQTMNKVWKHLNIPYYKIEDEEAKNTRTYKSEMKQETKQMLDRFFKPHNERLASLLAGHHDEWSENGDCDPWE